MSDAPYVPPRFRNLKGDPRDSAELDAELTAIEEDMLTLSQGLNELNATKAAVTVTNDLQDQINDISADIDGGEPSSTYEQSTIDGGGPT